MLTPPGMASLLLQSTGSVPNGSPVLLLILVLTVVGAITDWKYHKSGGRPSSRNERIMFWVLVLLIASAIAVTEYTGWDPYGTLGHVIVPLAAWLLFAWEIGRWRMRRKYPLAKAESEPTKPPAT